LKENGDVMVGTIRELAQRLWPVVLLRGVAALGLGVSLLTASMTTASDVVARLAAYWVVDGVLLMWAAAVARRHGQGGLGLLARGLITVLVGLWIFASPVVDVVGGNYRPGWFVSFLVLVPALLILVALQGFIAAVLDFAMWLAIRRELPGDWTWMLSAGIAVATSVLLWRSILGVAHPRAAAVVTILTGAGFILCAVRLRGQRSLTS
jgi:uncharacterized membrane protein HdeD (DUF308 family)